jgi:circadian clock protein KaiC
MHGFQVTIDPDERIQDFFAALSDYFIARNATFLFTAETPDLVGESSIRPPFPNASRMCHNIFLMRYAELRGKLTRVWSVFKMRDSSFDPALREVIVSDQGIRVGDRIDTADMMLRGQPLRAREDARE